MATASPAAPAPTIATSQERVGVRAAVYAALLAPSIYPDASMTGTVEIEPQVLQRRVRFVGSSELPMTCVRWLPHFGQTGGVVGRCIASSFDEKWTMTS